MPRSKITRRTLLRGALAGSAVAVGLPPLEATLNGNGTAFADGHEIPRRFGVWFWGNGVRPEQWTPSGTGSAWIPSAELLPLAAHREYLTVVSGTNVHTGTHPHHAGMTGVMTGAPLHQVGTTRDTIISTFARKSVDVLAADHYEGTTPLRSIEAGITRFRGTDEGTTFQHLSHNGPNNPNPSEYSAPALFSRIFGTPTDADFSFARQSVLDAVGHQIGGLQDRVGAHDRQRLEQHFESIRAIELRLAAEPVVCERPTLPSDHPDIAGREQIVPHNETMSQLVALALACDVTRVFSVLFSPAGSGVVIWQAGALNSLHQICHDEAMPQPTVHAATVFTMEQLAVMLQSLRDIPVGDDNLLDHSSIICTSEHADGRIHSYSDFPMLIAGKAGGALRGDTHYRSTTDESVSKAVLTALRAGGVPAESFGTEGGYVTDSIGEIEG